MQFRSARDWNNPQLLGKEPGKGDLGRCRLFLFSDNAKQFNQGLIRFEGLRREPREDAPVIFGEIFCVLR
jgi:hypothetical protein